MNIQSAQYVVLGDGHKSIQATIDEVEMSVPIEPANRHYAAILEWAKEDANEIAAAD